MRRSTVYGIIKKAGGHLTLKSSPGQGTRFEVFFPCRSKGAVSKHKREPESSTQSPSVASVEESVSKRAPDPPKASEPTSPGAPLPKGRSREDRPATKTILVAEDQPQLRELVRNVLAGLDHNLLMAADGDEALSKARNHPGPIHLLLTDMVMPNKSGVELAQELVKSSPDLKIIFMTGYSDDRIPREEEASHTLLQKPFSVPQLLDLVEKALQD